MSAESPRHSRSGGPLTVSSQPPPDRSIIHTVSDFISDVTLSTSSPPDPKDTILWARFETADINEPTPEGDGDNEISPLLLILGYGSGVQVWLVPPNGEAQEVLSWRQGTVRVLRILPTPASGDCYVSKRPLIALCDSAGPPPAFCALSFISVRVGEQVKSIKFKNAILDVQANKHSVVVSFAERFAVFDAGSLEDRMAITTCYPCPCPLGGGSPINPIALGDRWLAYADRKINPSKRSSGGCESEGVSSYTATVLHAAKSLSKGLRGLGESVAHSLSGGTRAASQSPSPPNADLQQPGVITIIDIESNDEDNCRDSDEPYEPIVAHFVAHSDAIIALKFDASGMLLVTADRRGHDFHVFRINPHPCGPALASVHHLYILHRGDTTARVQDIAISPDSRWAAVSTLRGTTHVFALSPYGGAAGVRTHCSPRVVNRLSRFHRSAGLPIHAGPAPVVDCGAWFANPRLPPYPTPLMVSPLAQLRPNAAINTHTITRNSSGRQRLSSLSEEGGSNVPLLARARFSGGPMTHGGKTSLQALYLMTHSGSLLLYLLQPKPAPGIPKEKVCDESAIELEVEAICQWPLQRPVTDLLAPLPHSSPLLQTPVCQRCMDVGISEEERWLSQVEIVTHAGPHRRLWMGPQFVFKTYNLNGSSSSLSEAETVEVDSSRGSLPRSNPVNMPHTTHSRSLGPLGTLAPLGPLLIDDGSASSLEHSPSETFRRKSVASDRATVCDVQLKEDLAEAMKEDHGAERRAVRLRGAGVPTTARSVDPHGTVVTAPRDTPASCDTTPTCDTPATCAPNADEDTFRCVLRAPAPPSPRLHTRPLPADTTIPVQSALTPRHEPQQEPSPLASHVLIPARLTCVDPDEVMDDMNESVKGSATASTVRSDIDSESLPKWSNRPEDDVRSEGVDVRVKKSPTSNTFNESVAKDDVSIKECKVIDVAREEDAAIATEITLKIPSRNKERSPKIKSSDKGSHKKYASPSKMVPEHIESNKKEEKPSSVERKSDLHQELKRNDILDDERIKNVDGGQSFGHEFKTNKIKEENNEIIIPKRPLDPEVKKVRQKADIDDDDVNVCFTLNTLTECRREKKKKNDDVDTNVKYKDPLKTKKLKTDDKYEKKPNHEEIITEQPHFDVKPMTNEAIEREFSKSKTPQIEIKTEQQAWDLLMNEPNSSAPVISAQTTEKIVEERPKTKKNRRSKFKAFTDDAIITKVEEDSFVEIHNIIDNQPASSDDLVSIPKCFEDTAPFIVKQDQLKYRAFDIPGYLKSEPTCDMLTETSSELRFDESNDFYDISKKEELFDDEKISNMFKSNVPLDYASAIDFSVPKENIKPRKAKSVSPFVEKKPDEERDDVIVIDSSKEEFPAIQITRGKSRKKLSVAETIQMDKSHSPKSWSSIAAGGVEIEPQVVVREAAFDEVSLQDKLMELCKRTDIMVAECDAPSELNFVEEHHIMGDLPPLEALDFALDDFKLEVMRDSLLETNDSKMTSPICKINIDDILCSIKDTTNKAIETSSFTYMSDYRVPGERSDAKKKEEMMEKSSDDDNTSPMASQTDSDKDDKRAAGTASLAPSSKQVKAKKSRKKKK